MRLTAVKLTTSMWFSSVGGQQFFSCCQAQYAQFYCECRAVNCSYRRDIFEAFCTFVVSFNQKTLGLKVTSLTLNAALVGIICVGTMGRTQLPSCRHKGHVNSPFLGLNGCI